jgi:FMN reductase
VLNIASQGAREAGATVELFDVRELQLPTYDPDLHEAPAAAYRLGDAVATAQSLLWSNKVVGLISVVGSVYGLQAVNTMESEVRALRGWSVPLVIPIPRAWQAFDEAGTPRDENIDRQFRSLGAEVVRAARQFALKGVCDYAEESIESGSGPSGPG